MLISLILIAVSLALFFTLKERFDQAPRVFRYGFYAALTLIIATVLTVEFFIYLSQRAQAFIDATRSIPGFIIILVFLGLLVGTWWLFLLLDDFNRERFQGFLRDTFVPKAKETFKDVAETSKMRWRGLRLSLKNPFKKKKVDAAESHKPPDETPD